MDLQAVLESLEWVGKERTRREKITVKKNNNRKISGEMGKVTVFRSCFQSEEMITLKLC